jgi:threonine dehydrogenase-like Zn-dependent dehydrogenase
MRALTVRPGEPNSLALTELPEPPLEEGPLLIRTLAVGLCGTDTDIVKANYGTAPPDSDVLVIGHENLGRVVEAVPDGSGLSPGDLVVGIVRRPDPVPCPACAASEWDMCLNGLYTEHGIKGLNGFARDRWRAWPDALVRLAPDLADVGVLVGPTSVVAKAWEQIDRIRQRAFSAHRVVAVTGAGPVGLLAALLGVERRMEVHVFDVVTDGPKPKLVADLGATYHTESLSSSGLNPDVVLECSGIASVIIEAMGHNARNAIVCLAGVSRQGQEIRTDIGTLNRTAVLENDVVFGTVNANRRHYEAGAAALARADRAWLRRLITRTAPVEEFASAFDRGPGDVKVVLEFGR